MLFRSSFNIEETVCLKLQLQHLATTEKLHNLTVLGKIEAVNADYIIIEGLSSHNQPKRFYTNTNGKYMSMLPDLSETIADVETCQLVGDPSFRHGRQLETDILIAKVNLLSRKVDK
jgi:hypothetical protein